MRLSRRKDHQFQALGLARPPAAARRRISFATYAPGTTSLFYASINDPPMIDQMTMRRHLF